MKMRVRALDRVFHELDGPKSLVSLRLVAYRHGIWVSPQPYWLRKCSYVFFSFSYFGDSFSWQSYYTLHGHRRGQARALTRGKLDLADRLRYELQERRLPYWVGLGSEVMRESLAT
jgi:hypothetical protein